MNRGLFFISFFSTAALLVTQACSSDESTGASDAGTSTSSTSTSSGNTSSGATSSGDPSSSSGGTDTCVAGGGACVCGGNTSPCPNGGTRDPALKCVQGPQGSGTCFMTCCKGGDSGMPPDATFPEAGPDAQDAADSG